MPSAWWGESFVNELKRISEQAERKRITHRSKPAERKSVSFDFDAPRPSTAPAPLDKQESSNAGTPSAIGEAAK